MKLFSKLAIQKMDFIIAVYIFCVVAAEIMGSKTFSLDIGPIHLSPTVAIFFVPFIYSLNDIITEVYGKERTRSVIRSGLIIIGLILITSVIVTLLPASKRFMESEAAYDHIFGKSARIAFASLTAFAIAEFLDVFIFAKVRQKLGKNKLWLRTNISNFASQFIDTVIFMTLAFYALNDPLGENIVHLWAIVLPYWLLKCAMSVIETPLVYLGVKWLKEDK